MTAPAIHPDAIDAALPDFDAEVACQWSLCDHPECQCDVPAVWRVTMHGARSTEDLRAHRCCTFTRPMCDPHVETIRSHVTDLLASVGPLDLCWCGRTVAQVSDLLLEVSAL
ncbi:hypothetical protein SEA_TIMTAM_58 [Gordonia phage TimTam]|uniref:Uncharacterized protein n=4 Tax=Nymphadoravirus nymphadora TaxID=2560507 RepID=A0A142KAT4_9CAUD|nr:tail fiber protein [Gordonia phage Nymphadora]AMS03217.1 hypothetical protein SEA_NYMPHADORA_58 [Gordonia phage Nymphadora]AOE43937.1 hypothetical protein SEA_BATSTARR_57 [Gordonia phage BatStarr]QDP43337.1 hypothetical protein SEA_EVIARTO_58 [Gordonia phage Eviarto]QDP43418.1 hypothetical protein SEA_TIMTAM_58 [Gordonia phage TimTam]